MEAASRAFVPQMLLGREFPLTRKSPAQLAGGSAPNPLKQHLQCWLRAVNGAFSQISSTCDFEILSLADDAASRQARRTAASAKRCSPGYGGELPIRRVCSTNALLATVDDLIM